MKERKRNSSLMMRKIGCEDESEEIVLGEAFAQALRQRTIEAQAGA